MEESGPAVSGSITREISASAGRATWVRSSLPLTGSSGSSAAWLGVTGPSSCCWIPTRVGGSTPYAKSSHGMPRRTRTTRVAMPASCAHSPALGRTNRWTWVTETLWFRSLPPSRRWRTESLQTLMRCWLAGSFSRAIGHKDRRNGR